MAVRAKGDLPPEVGCYSWGTFGCGCVTSASQAITPCIELLFESVGHSEWHIMEISIYFNWLAQLWVNSVNLPSVLWRCWLGGRKGIRPVKNWWVAGVAICLERGADLHMARLMPLPLTVSCLSKIQNGFTFLVPADLGSPRQRAVKRVVLCVCGWLS